MNNMKKKLVLFVSVAIALASCQTTPKEDYSWIKKGLDVASAQLQLLLPNKWANVVYV